MFVWQFLFSAPLEVASGAIGLAKYVGYFWPGLRESAWRWSGTLPGALPVLWEVKQEQLLAMAETVALLKPGAAMPSLLDAIDAAGGSVESALVRRAGRPDETVLRDTAAMRAAEPDYFSTLLVRRVDR